MPAASDKVLIFDTTLRDGELAPGANVNLAEKLEIAYALAALGVDVLDAGFPAASPAQFDTVATVARLVDGPIICALARPNRADIDRAWEALRDAKNKRLHVYLATSSIQRERRLHMDRAEILKHVKDGVGYAREKCDNVEFSPEDAARTELEFLTEVVERAIEAGATTINIPDTVGYAMPAIIAETFGHLKKKVRGIEKVTLSVHCHDDLGMAVANSLAAVVAGARQIECTINGIGERAGNAALEEVVMALKTRRDYFKLDTNIDTTKLFPVSRLVSSITGIAVQRNKAIVGKNAFAHGTRGAADDATYRETYEIMKPEEIGCTPTDLVLGKHSAPAAVRRRIQELGYHLDDVQFNRVQAEFATLASKKTEVYDADLEALVRGEMWTGPSMLWKLHTFHTSAGTGTLKTAAVDLQHEDGHHVQQAAVGDGPVDAVFKAIQKATATNATVRDYLVRSVSTGEDAQGEAIVELEQDGRSYRGRAVSTDVVEASALAFLTAVNTILRERQVIPETSAMMAAASRA